MAPDSDRGEQRALEARLARLEESVIRLSEELAAVRAELAGRALASPTSPALSVPRRPSAPPRKVSEARAAPRRIARSLYLGESVDVERLLGRYGMLGIAVLAAAAAVGTFLSWAVSHGYLTLPPRARVLVGLTFAAAVAAWGIRLRRTERSFGSSLLGLSLVIVLVCAYAAGPGLAAIPEWLAFAGAMLVSWALAVFARSENDEPLWCVAFAGAAITPFVTSSGKANLYGLVAYAASVLIAACFAVGARPWIIARRVFYAASALLAITGAVVSRAHGLSGFLAAFALPVVTAVAGVIPFAAANRKRAALRWQWILVAAAGFFSPPGHDTALVVSAVLLASAALWLAIVDHASDIEQSSILERNQRRTVLLDWIDAAVLPLILCFQAASAISPVAPTTVVYAIAAAMLIGFAWRRAVGSARDASVCAFLIAIAAGTSALRLESPAGVVLALLAIGLAALVLDKARPSASWVVGGGLAILLAAATSAWALFERPAFTRPPFATEASFTALCVAIALWLTTRLYGARADAIAAGHSLRGARADASDRELERALVVASPWAWAFLWGYLELSIAFSRSTSTLLLVVYFAACAVAGVAIGHMRQSSGARRVGLGLALLAAATAVYGARSFFEVGMRVLAYLVTSAFLLGIAYWYRRPGQLSAVDAAAPSEIS